MLPIISAGSKVKHHAHVCVHTLAHTCTHLCMYTHRLKKKKIYFMYKNLRLKDVSKVTQLLSGRTQISILLAQS